jgi:hypothetical protein
MRSRPVSTNTASSRSPSASCAAVDAAGDPQQDAPVADRVADLVDGGVHDGARGPVPRDPGPLHEPLEQRQALGGVAHLGVELQGVQAARVVLHRGDLGVGGRGGDGEPVGRPHDAVAVTHPGGERPVHPVEQGAVVVR